jgi:CpeT/CpcT family (DUF1001)
MRRWCLAATMAMLSGCQMPVTHADPAAGGDAFERLNNALPGDYDNDEQVRTASAGTKSGAQLAVPHMRERWKMLERGRVNSFWLWQLQVQDSKTAPTLWVYRLAPGADGKRLALTPYRALDPARVAAEFADPKLAFRFVPEHWAELAPCTLTGEWKNTQFEASADTPACSALLPGLGEAAALLPLRVSLDGEMLHAATFADQARGAAAAIDARRLSWFAGWSAINGAGANAKTLNQDWHTHEDLRLSSAGGRIPIRWRDGASSGYSLELQRRAYPERKLNVLQLNVIEDASGRAVDYAWTSMNADAVGINLGWLQVGLTKSAQ